MQASEGEPLTPEQQKQARETLRSYLGECYQRHEALVLPTFRTVRRTYHVDEIPGSATAATRHGEGSHGDPTAMQAIALAEGVTVEVPEIVRFPFGAVRALVEALPTHLYLPLARVTIGGETWYGASQALKIGQTTIKERIDGALDKLCADLYGARWDALAA